MRLGQGLGALARLGMQRAGVADAGPEAFRVLTPAAAVCSDPAGARHFSSYSPDGGAVIDGPSLTELKQGSTVVLVSGGIESAALLAYYTHWNHGQKLLPLFVDYGQKNVLQEEQAQQAMCRHFGLDFNAVNASMVAHQLNMATAKRRYHDALPHRNLILLSLAASFAANSGAANVATCLNRDDLGQYSTASLPFLRHMEAAYQELDRPLQLLMPLLALRKRQVIGLGQQVGAPWHLTHSCQEDGEAPCGACPSCEERAAAFEAAGVEDPLLA